MIATCLADSCTGKALRVLIGRPAFPILIQVRLTSAGFIEMQSRMLADFGGSLTGQKENHLAMLKAHDLLDVVDFGIAGDLCRAGVSHIQQLASAYVCLST